MRGEDRHRLAELGLDEHVDGAVLERLEGADLHAELLARAQVLGGHVRARCA